MNRHVADVISGLYLLLLVLTGTSAHASQNEQQLRFVVNTPGSFPYLYLNTGRNEYTGLVPSLLNDLSKHEYFVVDYLHSNQLRSEKMLLTNRADLYLVNPEWLLEPEKLLVSEPLLEHKTFLYAIQPFTNDFALTTLNGSKVCTRKNFVYTGLTAYFKLGNLIRMDADNDQAMLSMLVGGRCDFLVKNDYNAMQLFNSPQSCDVTFHQSPHATSAVPLTIILRPALQSFKQKLDRYIRHARDNGEIGRFLTQYTEVPKFPMRTDCSNDFASKPSSEGG